MQVCRSDRLYLAALAISFLLGLAPAADPCEAPAGEVAGTWVATGTVCSEPSPAPQISITTGTYEVKGACASCAPTLWMTGQQRGSTRTPYLLVSDTAIVSAVDLSGGGTLAGGGELIVGKVRRLCTTPR